MMKNLRKYILFWTALFILGGITLSFVLDLMNYQFLNWLKFTFVLISFIGVFLGSIQILKSHKLQCFIACFIELIIFSLIGVTLFIISDHESIVIKDHQKMIKETHGFLLSNWIKYYDYQNILIRSQQERIYEAYNNTLNEYLYTIYYDEDGHVIDQKEE